MTIRPLSLTAVLRIVLVSTTLLLASTTRVQAQAEPAGVGPGTYIQAGATFSSMQIDYGNRRLGGASAFVDAHLYRRIGAEAEVSTMRLNEDEGVHTNTYLIGPRVSFLAGRFRPYTKMMVGRGTFYFPFHYAQGSYFVYAPGGGIDWHVRRIPIAVRLVDVEFQQWPGFSFGPMHPYAISTGLAIRLF